MCAFALHDLVLMVRKNEIEAAAVDVEALAQIGLAHGRALDVPAGPAAAPGALPARQIRGRRLPQYEIAGVALERRDLDASTGEHLLARAARQLAIVGRGRDRKQHMPFGGIGMACSDQALDHRDHLRDVFGRARLDTGRQRPERRHIGMEIGGRARRQRGDRLVVLARRVDDLVFDIGDVADVDDVLGAVLLAQQPIELVEDDDRAAVADMREVVDGRPAHVHAHAIGIERLEALLSVGQRIVKRQWHRARLADRGRAVHGSRRVRSQVDQ